MKPLRSQHSSSFNGHPGITSEEPLLHVRDLKTYFYMDDGERRAVDGVGFSLKSGEIFGLVGESGCGKTVTALSILGLIRPPGKVVSGEVVFQGTRLLQLTEDELNRIRGRRISMIFQHPRSSLNPVFPIGRQLMEVLQIHRGMERGDAWQRALRLLRRMDIPDAERSARAYPHELSGGQAQRAMIAIALAASPDLLIADEPTTALDVTVQAQILELLRRMSSQNGTSIVLITHDLGVIAESADRVAVMYAGSIVEKAGVENLFATPMHPYTQALMASVPAMNGSSRIPGAIPGTAPNPARLPSGCRFAPRCRQKDEWGFQICHTREPDELWLAPDRSVRCWLYQDFDGHRAPLRAE